MLEITTKTLMFPAIEKAAGKNKGIRGLYISCVISPLFLDSSDRPYCSMKNRPPSQRVMKSNKSTCLRVFLLPILLFVFLESAFAQGVVENLDEMFARKARKSTASWSSSVVENSSTYIWQPETFSYHDVTTGHEVWKLSHTPGLTTYYHNDIGVSPWSADGSKMAFTAWHRVTQAYSQLEQVRDWRYIWMTSDTSGNAMRPTVEAQRRIGGWYFNWSAQEVNTWYEIGEHHLSSGGLGNVLYRSTLDSGGVVTSQAVLTLPAGAANANINKLISADGRRIILERSNRFWPISILANGTAQLDDADGYSVDRNFGPYGGMNGGTVGSPHDQYIAGTGDDFFVMPNDPGSTATWWRMTTVGTAPDGGASIYRQ